MKEFLTSRELNIFEYLKKNRRWVYTKDITKSLYGTDRWGRFIPKNAAIMVSADIRTLKKKIDMVKTKNSKEEVLEVITKYDFLKGNKHKLVYK